ncbi:uncharacterized protein BDCG_16919 [Blastomyces dermatitidis ER-3]|uniref:Uncharacterized protein n=1 Tax=Ajellomyces dermatitidis (strain ER-3 / ATCC MYA-2586) TaxID=559297 RepID=A0ABP2F2M0_AJEDR|nr:uncharacterized protein BDCG_16919 [Blastomyces dermatitidis ER-3]EEQ89196.2 hypothetical protein BDCG_16919 [Blastomyces dermatitidis ER-3]
MSQLINIPSSSLFISGFMGDRLETTSTTELKRDGNILVVCTPYILEPDNKGPQALHYFITSPVDLNCGGDDELLMLRACENLCIIILLRSTNPQAKNIFIGSLIWKL